MKSEKEEICHRNKSGKTSGANDGVVLFKEKYGFVVKRIRAFVTFASVADMDKSRHIRYNNL